MATVNKPTVPEPVQQVAPVQPVAPVEAQPAPVVQQTTPVQPVQPTQPEMSDRTREQFEKLLENNKRLHDANQLLTQEVLQRTQLNQQFSPFQNGGQPAPMTQDFVEIDPDTGQKYINESKLHAQLDSANQRALKAEQAVQNYIQASEQREVQRQEKETFAAYPDLNPSNPQFNAGLSNQVSATILHSMMNPRQYGGKPLTFLEAASLVRGTLGMSVQTAPQAPAPVQTAVREPQGASAQDIRAAASVDLQSEPQQVRVSPEVEQQLSGLKARTRLGDDQALAERLKYTEHLVPKDGTA